MNNSEEQPSWSQQAPHLLELGGKVRLVTSEMQHRTADDCVDCTVFPGKRIESSAVQMRGGERRIQGDRQLTHRGNRGRIGVRGAHLERAPKVRKVTPGTAPRIEHTTASIESSAEELVEEIDIDLAELHTQFGGYGRV